LSGDGEWLPEEDAVGDVYGDEVVVDGCFTRKRDCSASEQRRNQI
jgi:hypothetical protein